MFNKTPDPQLVALDKAITAVYSDMEGFTSDTDEYDKMTDQLNKLLKLREELTSGRKVSPDALAGVLANLVGIAMILHHEKVHVITSKALGFVMKAR